MIDVRRRDGRMLRIGHRGAAALAPESGLNLDAVVTNGPRILGDYTSSP